MATSTTGYDYPTMMQQFYAPKSARGSRLGRGPAMASTMVQYGYSQPGTNINVSPTFSNIGNPDVYTEGLSIGDVSLGDFGGGFDGGFDEEAPTPTPGPTPGAPAGPTGGTSGKTSGGGAPKPPVGSSLKLSGSAMEALRKAEQKGQSKDPRVTKGELKSVLQGGGQGPRGIRNAILEGKVQIGGKAADFLNRQLEKVGGKPLPKIQTKSDPAPKGGGQKQQPVPVIGLMNKASQPGTTNMKPQAQPKKQEAPKQQAKQQAPKPAAPKAEAKKKAEAKASGGKKKK